MVQPGSSSFEITTALQAKQKIQESSRKVFGEESSKGQEGQVIKQHQSTKFAIHVEEKDILVRIVLMVTLLNQT